MNQIKTRLSIFKIQFKNFPQLNWSVGLVVESNIYFHAAPSNPNPQLQSGRIKPLVRSSENIALGPESYWHSNSSRWAQRFRMNISELVYLQIVQEKCPLLDFFLNAIDYMQKIAPSS